MADRVSVIIPTYERDSVYLDRAIDSLLKQTYPNVEIVVIDDNKSDSKYRDSTVEYMKKHASNENIKYVLNEKNLGGALSRNKGIEVATGHYITFLDDDDEYLPEKIEKQVQFMKSHDYDMSFTNLLLVNENKKVIDFRKHDHVNDFSKEALLKTHIMRKLTGTPTFMYKKESLLQIGGFDDVPIGQEFHLMLKTIENDLSMGHLKRSDVRAYRHNQGGISFGESKIKGERDQYKFIKQKYFYIFNKRERMFIRFRYHLVFAMAYKRNRKPGKALVNVLLAFLNSPVDSVLESYTFFKNVRTKRNSYQAEEKFDIK